jgi:hypothetical protein
MTDIMIEKKLLLGTISAMRLYQKILAHVKKVEAKFPDVSKEFPAEKVSSSAKLTIIDKVIFGLYGVVLIATILYSYSLLDLNFTFMNYKFWATFRNAFIQIGYFQRELSSYLFMGLVILLFAFHFYLVRHYKKVKLWFILVPMAIVGLLSYPFLSHDFFNYLFDAKIFTFYHQNPYLQRALDYPNDPWIRFMHWTHRTYPYGPVFLVMTIIPSFLGMGKFVLHFFLFKGMSFVFYLITVWLLYKMNKKWAIFFATQPLVILEGLVSNHNDFIAVSLGIVGIYFLYKNIHTVKEHKKAEKKELKFKLWTLIKEQFLGRLFFVLSTGIKYVSFPSFFIVPKNLLINFVCFIVLIVVLYYETRQMGIQPWYFLNLLLFLPVLPSILLNSEFFFFGLLMSYYPYIRLGEWGSQKGQIEMKTSILLTGLIINLIWFALIFCWKWYKTKKLPCC